jgi:hypothetical protein
LRFHPIGLLGVTAKVHAIERAGHLTILGLWGSSEPVACNHPLEVSPLQLRGVKLQRCPLIYGERVSVVSVGFVVSALKPPARIGLSGQATRQLLPFATHVFLL